MILVKLLLFCLGLLLGLGLLQPTSTACEEWGNHFCNKVGLGVLIFFAVAGFILLFLPELQKLFKPDRSESEKEREKKADIWRVISFGMILFLFYVTFFYGMTFHRGSSKVVMDFPNQCVVEKSYEKGKLFLKSIKSPYCVSSPLTVGLLEKYVDENRCVEVYLDGEYLNKVCLPEKDPPVFPIFLPMYDFARMLTGKDKLEVPPMFPFRW